jgi:hypothetical protein
MSKVLTNLAKKKNFLKKHGFSGFNKPKATPGHGSKSHAVAILENGNPKLIRFGQPGVKTNQTAGQREAFKSRHGKNIAKGKTSPAYWANKVKWSPSKTQSPSKKWKKGS